jgi:hypothetical protein
MRRVAAVVVGVGVALVIGLLPQGGAQAQVPDPVNPPREPSNRVCALCRGDWPWAGSVGAGAGDIVSPSQGLQYRDVRVGSEGIAKEPEKKTAPLSPEVIQGMFAQTPSTRRNSTK